MRAYINVFIAIALTVTAIGCSRDKGSKKANVSNRYDRSRNWDQDPDGRYAGQAGDGWGQIYSSNGVFTNLNSFMAGIDVGQVSGRQNDTTGIRFRGQVDVCRRSGQIDMLVWDDIANSYDPAEPFYWTADVVETSDNNGSVVITVQDSAGEIIFIGNDNGSQYTGTVKFVNRGDSRESTLGLFSIASSAILRCN